MTTALILSGGGARAAYQVGVLKAVGEIVEIPRLNPFGVLCGSSAGAINASLLGCESDHFANSVRQLEALWLGLSSRAVHEVGMGAILSSLGRAIYSMMRGGDAMGEAMALLDNAPLRKLLAREVDFNRLQDRLVAGDLDSLVISVLSYRAGKSVSFFSSKRDIGGWDRHRRVGVPTPLALDHLMASAAIPGIYPPVQIGNQYYGDGAIRMSAPLSPALHLGARRLFVIGVSHNPSESGGPEEISTVIDRPPSLAHMASHFLNGPFIDALEEDLESLLRINEIAEQLDEGERKSLGLSVVDVMCIAPSRRFDEIAASHVRSLPASMRFLMKTLGGTRAGGGASLASYLMFESPFISELIDCGYQDAMSQQGEVARFLMPGADSP